jgi:hypothetical protein
MKAGYTAGAGLAIPVFLTFKRCQPAKVGPKEGPRMKHVIQRMDLSAGIALDRVVLEKQWV